MGIKSYRDLDVFKKAYAIGLIIHKLSLEFPKIEQYALADQMRRASKSICGNLAEGYARKHLSEAEFKRFLMLSLGSSEELRVWIQYAYDLNYINEETWKALDNEYEAVSKMIYNLHKKWKN